MPPNILFGVHNETHNIDFYDDNTINIYDHETGVSVTTFKEEDVAVFVAILQRDGYLDKLLEVNTERLRNEGFLR